MTTSSVEKLGVAIQGAGNVSTEHLRAYLANPHCEVVAIASRTTEGAQRKAHQLAAEGLDLSTVRVYDDYAALLADPRVDAVSLCTPPHRHADEVIRGAQAGKHLLIEKPVALSPDELSRMDAAVSTAGVKTVVSFVLRWNPLVLTIKRLTQDGAFGHTFFVQTAYWHNVVQGGYPGARPGPKQSTVSSMLGGGCHAMDMARYLMDSDITQVTALTKDTLEGHASPANTAALVKFANGAMGYVSACTEQWMPYVFNIDLFGDQGAIRGNRYYTKQLPGATGFVEIPTILPDSGSVSHHPFRGEIDHFIACIRTGSESHVSLHDAVNTHQACFAADHSAAHDATPVTLPLHMSS
ncbi:MAG TPA: Gfo/Idh/MocA family oxidoreductase [Chloroflexota bacterium]|nr:Gfo/Idh/MocA family oxidoreductase [Chloroflexota bacterium]